MRAEVPVPLKTGPAPWTVWAYAAIQIFALAAYVASREVHFGAAAGPILLEILVVVGLIKGVRLAWIVALFFQAIGVLGSIGLISRIGEDDQNVGLVLIQISLVVLGLIVLLHPRTRQWTRPT